MDKISSRFIRGLHNLKPNSSGSVVTIGSFDGVHLGHAAILERLKEKASEYNQPSVAVIFEPHPAEFFSGEQAPARLLRTREKIETLFELGIDQVCCLQFGDFLRSLSAKDFILQVLVNGLNAKFLMVGDDFHFGCNREGDYQTLSEAGLQYGFEVEASTTIEYEGKRISSTWVRETLEQGDFSLAQTLLGRHYAISGKVVYGQQLGRQLGFPTANIQLNRYRAPLNGVYIVEMTIHDNGGVEVVPGVANVGVRPTLGNLIKPVLEVFLLGFDRNIYGKRVRVEFVHKIREEKKYSSLDDLKEAIKADVVAATEYFSEK